jgi:hypothetical protein
MALTLTKEPTPEITGPITISAEWNHSCTSQCPNPCPASSRLTQPGVTARIPQQPGPQSPPPKTPKVPQQPGPRD